MELMRPMNPFVVNLSALAGGLFLVSAFGIVAARQVRGCLRFFIFQSLFLALAAFLLGSQPFSIDLIAVGILNLLTKVWLIPWLLRRLVREEIYTRREITQALSIPTSLLIALVLTIGAYFFSLPWISSTGGNPFLRIDVPVGLAGLFLGAHTLTTRREAVPQLLGLLAMENGAFFAGIAMAPTLPLIAELALAFDILILTFVVGVLTHAVHERVGTTAVGTMTKLREEVHE